jgi:hypothetical protein
MLALRHSCAWERIEREVRYAQVAGVERARQWRSLLAGRGFPDLTAYLQVDRSR